MSLNLVAGPGAEPLHLTEAKQHCRIELDSPDEDVLMSALIVGARQQAEADTRRSMVLQTWDLTLDCFPAEIRLPGPVRSVVSVTYVDTDGDTQTLAASDYTADIKSTVGRLVPAYGLCWPSTRDHVNSVTVRFKTGFAVPFSAVAATNVITATGHTHANGDVVRLSNSGGALPAGLAVNTDYYVIGVSGDTLQLSATSGGGSIDITGTGTGTHFIGVVPEAIRQAMKLLLGHWFENRGAANIGNITSEIPMGVNMLLAPHKAYGF